MCILRRPFLQKIFVVVVVHFDYLIFPTAIERLECHCKNMTVKGFDLYGILMICGQLILDRLIDRLIDGTIN